MTALASLLSGLSVFTFVAHYTGHLGGLRLGRRRRHRLSWRAWLAQAGVDVTPAQFVVVSAGLGLVVLLLCSAVSGSPVVGAVPAAAATAAPYGWFAAHRKRRLHAVVSAWPDGILHVLNAMRAGASVHSAIVDLASSGPVPLQEAFRFYEGWAQVSSMTAALVSVREQLAEPVSDKAIAVLIEAGRHGTDVALAILKELGEQIREDERTTATIRAAQREPSITGWVAFFFPWAIVLVGCMVSSTFRDFYGSPSGRVIAGVGAAGSIALLLATRALAREAPEPRVIGGEA